MKIMKNMLRLLILPGIFAQFGAIGIAVHKNEMTLRHGAVYRFKTSPVDPFDALHGRHVQLWFENDNITIPTDAGYNKRGKSAYAQFGADTDGFAVLEAVHSSDNKNLPLMKTRAHTYEEPGKRVGGGWESTNYHTRVYLPFDRYYMPEKLAPEEERAYLGAGRIREQRSAAAVVRVWKGNAVIEDLEIDGIPILEYLKRQKPNGN